ncbi:MAG: NAD-dependent epimerase/dehydratase family protein, partial [Planctomycetes bacterium]|nr:NAD-dependent epimerase/dehydratase family protein [Planctomycetota bacterium]
MRVLVTGHRGYIGSVLTCVLRNQRFEVCGLDSDLFAGCDFGRVSEDVPGYDMDVRDVDFADLISFDAVVHLAGLSDDACGMLNPDLTQEINVAATQRLAECCKKANVARFLFASTCDIYGRVGRARCDETYPTSPMSEAVVHLPRLHAGQLTVRAGRARFTVLQCGRRFGKTKYGEDEAIDPALHGYPVGWFAPTYKIMQGAWDELVDVLRDVIVTANKTDAKIILIGGGSIEFWSLHNNEDAGRSRKYKRIIVDEAGLIRNLRKIWHASLRATLADYKGDALFLGTPKGHNDFHRLYLLGQGGDPDWASFRMGTITNPFIAPSEIEAARRSLPKDIFDQEFMGIPAEDGGNPFGLSHIAACVRDMRDKPAEADG